ncbi:hypothetical protein CSB45_04575 [candidate division KSB3 bacterium]|uniref:C4-type zinc ribbon domain-containing protein n=1 Tax=candidate division KSB3 bacterium TaxID=2044937 RepID=A0A2G6E8S6_9BACT|nr:MAG: hypothetical protein CSB45_04575 [candidate division KSB3 bacterium]PIE30651.1 MAG: hypothetical protein CSA57_03160 [candidate division KSB3 bacterium]
MNKILQTLIELQDVDAIILSDRQRIEAFPGKIRDLDTLLHDGEHKIAQITASINEQEKIRRSKELEIESNVEKIKKYQGQLTHVKTNKEYSALLAEITGLKNKNTLSEDDILELMESVERAKAALLTAQQELGVMQSRVTEEKQSREEELCALQKEVENKQQIRDELAGKIEQGVLKEYDRILKLRHGLAVSRVGEEGICSGCHVALTPQMHAEVKTGDFLHRCPVCFRYVYWAENDGEEGAG